MAQGLAEQVRDTVQAAFDAVGEGVPVRFGSLTAEPGELPRAMLAPLPAENAPGDYVSGEAVTYVPLALYLRVRPLTEGDRLDAYTTLVAVRDELQESTLALDGFVACKAPRFSVPTCRGVASSFEDWELDIYLTYKATR